jgi:hypothetical protein
VRVHIADPDGMARPGEFNVYTVERWLFMPDEMGLHE